MNWMCSSSFYTRDAQPSKRILNELRMLLSRTGRSVAKAYVTLSIRWIKHGNNVSFVIRADVEIQDDRFTNIVKNVGLGVISVANGLDAF